MSVLRPPIEPMLAKPLGHAVGSEGANVLFEPKWDGFRCLVFREQNSVFLQGRGRSREPGADAVDLAYAFPELVDACMEQLRPGTVLDGEIVAAADGRLDFGTLQSRLRPRSEAGGTNIAKLAATVPALLLLFDLLADADGTDRTAEPFGERRERLADLANAFRPPLLLTPGTTDTALARRWFVDFESAGIDGLMVKDLRDPYTPGKRTQGKIKHERTIDVVVGGWRPYTRPGPSGEPVVGSLLLGVYGDDDVLHYLGVASAFTAKVRAELAAHFAPIELGPDDPHPWRGEIRGRIPGGISRWSRGADQEWRPISPMPVAEVTYDQLEDGRFRHVAGFVRWRPDRQPGSCHVDQLEVPPQASIDDLLGR